MIEGILSSEGSGFIAGEEKLGKTFYALEEALCLALGLTVCGRFAVPVRKRVLFIEEEDARGRVKARIEALLRGHGVNANDPMIWEELNEWFQVGVWRGMTFDDEDMLNSLERTIQEFRPRVVYLDALRKLTTRDLNKADEASKILQRLDGWRHEYGCLFRIVHHFRKGQGGYRTGRGSQEISGSYVLGAWPEMSLFFSPMGKQHGCAKAVMQSKDGVPLDPFKITIHTEEVDGVEVIRLMAEDLSQGSEDHESLKEQIVESLNTCEQTEGKGGKSGVLLRTLMKALKRNSDKPVREALKALAGEGRIKKADSASKGADLWVVCG